MNLGKRVRLNRLFAHPSGRFCSVAVDHFIGYQAGLPEGLRDLPAALRAIVAAGPDAVTMHKGVALSCWGAHAGKVPLILQTIIGRPDDSADESLATPEDAVRLGADAVATAAFVRGPTEAAHMRRAADAVRAAEAWEMPVVLHVYPRSYQGEKVEVSYQPEDIAWAVRCAIELGVDIIKVPYCGDVKSYAQIVRACPCPIVAAGGPKTNHLEEALEVARSVVASGAKGMTIGRNIWGDAHIEQNLQAFKAVLHQPAGAR
ncbi:MAG: aldolase [Verrucomicrobia bacterium]|nr:aldolase [Verrucomicrobiota bacterium]